MIILGSVTWLLFINKIHYSIAYCLTWGKGIIPLIYSLTYS